jgi:hypothetical protein
MTTHVLQFIGLSDQDREAADPPKAAAPLKAPLGHLLRGERVAVLAEGQELSSNGARDMDAQRKVMEALAQDADRQRLPHPVAVAADAIRRHLVNVRAKMLGM